MEGFPEQAGRYSCPVSLSRDCSTERNRAFRADNRAKRLELLAKLRRWAEKVDDPFCVPEE